MNEDEANNQEQAKGSGASDSSASKESTTRLTVVELAPLSLQGNGKPGRKVTLTCELPEAISEQIKPGMGWDGENWLHADGTPVEMRELSTA